jgi:hypothetical protein
MRRHNMLYLIVVQALCQRSHGLIDPFLYRSRASNDMRCLKLALFHQTKPGERFGQSLSAPKLAFNSCS